MIEQIRCEQVSFRYTPEQPILQGVSCTFSRNEFVGLVGANGSGKTTLARLLHGSLTPTSGSIQTAGLKTEVKETRVALVGSDPANQLITTSVMDEVAFSLRAARLSPEEVLARTQQGLMLFDLLTYAHQHPGLLSIGEQLRVLIASAVVRRPAYLLLDEVASMLDAKHWRAILQVLLEVQANTHTGILLITHRLEDLAQADRVLVMKDGGIVMEGTMEEVLARASNEVEWGIEVPLLYQVRQHITSPELRAKLTPTVDLQLHAYQAASNQMDRNVPN